MPSGPQYKNIDTILVIRPDMYRNRRCYDDRVAKNDLLYTCPEFGSSCQLECLIVSDGLRLARLLNLKHRCNQRTSLLMPVPNRG